MEQAARTGQDRGYATATSNLESLLCAWQSTGSHAALEALIHAAEPVAALVVARVLRQRGIRDPSALDDALALVFNHLRRLPGPAEGEHAVVPFDPARGAAVDHGRAYLQRLAHDRAIDVARSRRREARRVAPFSALEPGWAVTFTHRAIIPATPSEPEDSAEAGRMIEDALADLEPREREVVRLLLEGKSQAVIAHVLGVCGGTVSRLRGRAIAKLRAATQTRSFAGRGETPAPPARAARPGRARASPRRGPPGPSAPA